MENGCGTSLDRILEHHPCCDRSKLDRALFQPIDPSIRPRFWSTARSPPPCSLPDAEVAATARSVHKYRARWITKGKYYTARQRRLWGRERQARGVAKRRERNADRDRAIVQAVETGESMRSVARRFGLSRMQVWRIVNRKV